MMAIDPRIALTGQVPNVMPALGLFQNNIAAAQNRALAQAQEERAQALAPFQLQQAQQSVEQNQQTLNQNRNTQRLQNLYQTGQRLKPLLASNDIAGAQKFMLDNISNIQSRIEQGSGEDVTESMEVLAKLQSGDVQGVMGDIAAVEGLVRGAPQVSVGQKDFQAKVELVKGDPELKTPEAKAAAISLGLEARASSSANIEIAKDPTLTAAVASSQAEIAEAKETATEGAKLTQQMKHKPAIAARVKLAEKEATERGDVLTDLSRMEAGLPGLKDAVSQLKELSALATSTFGGKVFDQAVKQTGFGSTKGATARAKMKAIIANQTLPLLKETFGSAFTEAEGARLEASFADPDASHEERLAQLDAFIDQKERTIRSKKAQVNQVLNFDAQGNLIK